MLIGKISHDACFTAEAIRLRPAERGTGSLQS